MPAFAGMTKRDCLEPSLPRPSKFRYHAGADMGRGHWRANRAASLTGTVGDEMDYASCRSLPAMFFELAREKGARPFLWAKRDGQYRPLSWAEAADAVGPLAQSLVALG